MALTRRGVDVEGLLRGAQIRRRFFRAVVISLVFAIAFRPATVAELFRAIGSIILDIAHGFGDFFINLFG